jgi:hypothetical protein
MLGKMGMLFRSSDGVGGGVHAGLLTSARFFSQMRAA